MLRSVHYIYFICSISAKKDKQFRNQSAFLNKNSEFCCSEIKMHKKRDLKIDTEFFDDNLNELAIPQAILIAPSVSQQSFMKSGLNEEDENYQFSHSQDSIVYSAEMIEKIMSLKLFDHFLWCWQKLKDYGSILDDRRQSNFSQSKHRRLLPEVHNISLERERVFQAKMEQSDCRRDKFPLLQVNSLGERTSRLEWLEQKAKIGQVNSKRIIIANRGARQNSTGKSQLERANILKQIVQKLKQSRKEIHESTDGVQHIRQNYQLNYKADRLQRLNENMHWQHHSQQSHLCCHFPLTKPIDNNKQHAKHLIDNKPEQDVTHQLRSQFASIRRQIQELRKSNQDVLKIQTKDSDQLYQLIARKQQEKRQELHQLSLKQDLSKRQQLHRMEEAKLQVQRTCLMLRHQIANLQQHKIHNDDKASNLQPIQKSIKISKYQTKISQLQSKIKQLQSREQIGRTQQVPESISYVRNHSRYYNQLLTAIPSQNSQMGIQSKQIESFVKQSNILNSDPVCANQFGYPLQRQMISKQQGFTIIKPQERQWNSSCQFC